VEMLFQILFKRSVDQLWLRVGSENLRFSSRGYVFLILAQEDSGTRFNS